MNILLFDHMSVNFELLIFKQLQFCLLFLFFFLKHVDKITVFVDSDFAGDPVSRKSTTGLVAQIGNHTVKSGPTLQSLTALSVGEAEFYAVVEGGQVGLSLRSMSQDLGIPMQIEKVTVRQRIL